MFVFVVIFFSYFVKKSSGDICSDSERKKKTTRSVQVSNVRGKFGDFFFKNVDV